MHSPSTLAPPLSDEPLPLPSKIERSQLQQAIKESNLDSVISLLDKYPHILYIPIKGVPLLCLAIRYGSLDIADYLLKKDARIVNMDDTEGNTALHYAAQKDFPTLCYELIRLGCHPKKQNAMGLEFISYAPSLEYIFNDKIPDSTRRQNVIYHVIKTFTRDEFQYFFGRNIESIVALFPTSTLLHFAAECGNFFVFKQLFSLQKSISDPSKIDISALDEKGRIPLRKAQLANRQQLIEDFFKTELPPPLLDQPRIRLSERTQICPNPPPRKSPLTSALKGGRQGRPIERTVRFLDTNSQPTHPPSNLTPWSCPTHLASACSCRPE
jgi:ankyrin repeat protein